MVRDLKVSDKDVKYLVEELGMDKIRASNLLRKMELKKAIQVMLDQ